MCAHGGDAAIGHPANTQEAVLAAAAAGARCVELDLSITADGKLVPLHARELQLLSGRPAAQVDDLLLADVEALEWCDEVSHQCSEHNARGIYDQLLSPGQSLRNIDRTHVAPAVHQVKACARLQKNWLVGMELACEAVHLGRV